MTVTQSSSNNTAPSTTTGPDRPSPRAAARARVPATPGSGNTTTAMPPVARLLPLPPQQPLPPQLPPRPPTGRAAPVRTPRLSKRARQPLATALRTAGWQWWGWTERPLSLRAAWRASTVNPARIPNGDGGIAALWKLSNWLDRPLWFVLILLAPTVATGPLRWIAARPTRRFGCYILVVAVSAAAWLTR